MSPNLHGKQSSFILFPIEKPMAARSKACNCDRSLAGILFSVPSGGGANIFVSCECCVLSGTGLCVGPVTCPEEFY